MNAKERNKRNAEIIQAYQDGVTTELLAAKWDLGKSYVKNIVTGKCVPTTSVRNPAKPQTKSGRPRPKVNIKARNESIVADYETGYSYAFLTAKYKIGRQRLYQIIRRAKQGRVIVRKKRWWQGLEELGLIEKERP